MRTTIAAAAFLLTAWFCALPPVQAAELTQDGPTLKGCVKTDSGVVAQGRVVVRHYDPDQQRRFGQELDALGCFSIEKLTLGKAKVGIAEPGFDPLLFDIDITAEPEVQHLSDLTFKTSTGILTGRILDPEGSPVAGATILLDSNDTSVKLAQFRRGLFMKTEKGGEYRLEKVPAGTWNFLVTHRNFPNSVQEITITRELQKVDFHFPKEGHFTVQATVKDEAGNPLPLHYIMIFAAALEIEEPRYRMGITDLKGEVSIPKVTLGTKRIAVGGLALVSHSPEDLEVVADIPPKLDIVVHRGVDAFFEWPAMGALGFQDFVFEIVGAPENTALTKRAKGQFKFMHAFDPGEYRLQIRSRKDPKYLAFFKFTIPPGKAGTVSTFKIDQALPSQ